MDKDPSRQRRDISIEIGGIYNCTPAECYVFTANQQSAIGIQLSAFGW